MSSTRGETRRCMKALVTQQHQTRVEEVPRPTFADSELLLHVAACGVCFSDIHKIRFRGPEKPIVLGHELTGRVVETGKDALKFQVGDRVVVAHHVPCLRCHYCRRGNISMCPQFKATKLDPACLAEIVRIPATHVESVAFLIPAGLSYSEASFMDPLGCCVRAV